MRAESEIEAAENTAANGAVPAGERRLVLLDLLIAMLERKGAIARVTMWAILLTMLVVVLIPNHYRAQVLLAPPRTQLSLAASMLGDVKTVASLTSPDLGLKDPNDVYIEMLNSRSVADAVIVRFGLQKEYDDKTMADTRADLEKVRRFNSNTGGTLSITVEDKNAIRAAAMADYYADQLRRVTHDLAQEDAKARRMFYVQQQAAARDGRRKAEADLAALQEKTGLLNIDQQAKALVDNVSSVHAQIAAREVEMRRLSAYETPDNPDVVRLQREIAGLNEQARKLEQTSASGDGNPLVATKKLPQATLDYLRKYREVRFYSDLDDLLQRQIEVAEIDAIALPVSIQTIDDGLPPEKKAWPKRGLIIALSAFLAIVFSSLFYTIKAAGQQGMIDVEVQARLRRIAALLGHRQFRIRMSPEQQ